jgi:hypothetical protein
MKILLASMFKCIDPVLLKIVEYTTIAFGHVIDLELLYLRLISKQLIANDRLFAYQFQTPLLVHPLDVYGK